MKVKELIKALGKLNPELKVICPTDDECNGYVACYLPDTAYCADLNSSWIENVYYSRDLEEYKEENELDELPMLNCVVL